MMLPGAISTAIRTLFFGFSLVLVFAANSTFAAGITLITHGYAGNADGWVTGMADRIPFHPEFFGTNFTVYELTITRPASGFSVSALRTAGASPLATGAGEIIVKVDWGELAGGILGYSTYEVAAPVVQALLETNLIVELRGHALAELPLHLIGHSRGGSLVCEISRLLGTNGVWVDHVTTLDPHPLNNDGNFDPLMPIDASASNTYANVLFRDNYWQNYAGGFLDFNGEPAAGAYNRQLEELSGAGYSTYHSDVHLWYHGTIDLSTPASDTEASITTAERQAWWVPYEALGRRAGFYYTLIAGGDRLSAEQPLGSGSDAIRDGFNQAWNLGAGTLVNRAALPGNSGAWPNAIRMNRADTRPLFQGQTMEVEMLWQWAQPESRSGTARFYLDEDLNPLNQKQRLLGEFTFTGSGNPSIVKRTTLSLQLNETNAPPGFYALYVQLNAGTRKRYLYALEPVQILGPPQLDIVLGLPG